MEGKKLSDRANNETSAGGAIQTPTPRVIGNVVVVCSSCSCRVEKGKEDTYSFSRARLA